MNSYIERAKTLIRQVKVLSETLTPLSQVLHIVDHLPEVYDSIASTITSWEEADINVDRAERVPLADEHRRKARAGADEGRAFLVRG